jgi:hypothetical protein
MTPFGAVRVNEQEPQQKQEDTPQEADICGFRFREPSNV